MVRDITPRLRLGTARCRTRFLHTKPKPGSLLADSWVPWASGIDPELPGGCALQIPDAKVLEHRSHCSATDLFENPGHR